MHPRKRLGLWEGSALRLGLWEGSALRLGESVGAKLGTALREGVWLGRTDDGRADDLSGGVTGGPALRDGDALRAVLEISTSASDKTPVSCSCSTTTRASAPLGILTRAIDPAPTG
jgi:hypothetical protein